MVIRYKYVNFVCMKKGIFLFALIISTYCVFAQQQDSIFCGRIIDVSTLKGADNIHVINIRNGYGTVSDMHGYFRIKCIPGDSVLISSVQFQKKIITVIPGNDTVLVYVETVTYMLPVAKVFKFRTYDDFKDAVLALPKELYEGDEIPWFRDYFNQSKDEFTYVKSFSPITYLYDKYSKKALELKRYNYLIEQEKVYDLVAEKYNSEIVSNLTGLTSPEEIKKFMDFCNLPPAFVIKAKDYEVCLAIIDCFRKYTK